MRRNTVALGLGSNLNKPIEQLRAALHELKKVHFLKVKDVSSLYESDAVLPDAADNSWNKRFLNAAVLCELDSETTAEALLKAIKDIEKKLGRVAADRWAPRIIDIDILFWDRESYHSTDISVPHAHLLERPFALLPLLDVWPAAGIENLPSWANPWIAEKPFNTQISKKLFWPRLVGILNITSDSFSDGGRFLKPDALLQQVDKLLKDGAEILDIGAESTRPQATQVTVGHEMESVLWALTQIAGHKSGVSISLDTRHAAVAISVMEKFNISFLNDVSGFSTKDMQDLLKQTEQKAFVMHSLEVPPRPDNTLSLEKSPVEQLKTWWQEKKESLLERGISEERLVFDPGIGFGTSRRQSLYVLNNLDQFADINSDIMIGHSRKSYQTEYSDRPAAERDLETSLVTQKMNMAYTQYLRIHDVQSQVIALRSRGVVV